MVFEDTTVTPSEGFPGLVPPPTPPSDYILSALDFMHPLEQWGTPKLVSVIAYQVLGSEFHAMPSTFITAVLTSIEGEETSVVYLNQSSFIDLTPLVKENLTVTWTPPDDTKTWKVFSFWETFTNQRACDGGPNATNFIGNGSWTVDHFSKDGALKVTDFWDEYILSDEEVADLLRSVGKYGKDAHQLISPTFEN